MSDELSAALRELAATNEAPPAVGGAEIRDRAMRRRRRRRAVATLGAGAAALALLGFALTLHLGGNPDHPAGRRAPAATRPDSASPSAATPAPVSGTLDLPRRTLTFDGRVMPILSKLDVPLGSTNPMTVVAKPVRAELTVDEFSNGRTMVNGPYAVELRAGADQPIYVGPFSPQLKALSDGWIGLASEDASWLFARVSIGDTISVRTGATPTIVPPGAVAAPGTATPGATPSASDEAHVAPSASASPPVREGAG
ncbi:L,D-transpeptidase [Streptomyces sp. NPDC002671]